MNSSVIATATIDDVARAAGWPQPDRRGWFRCPLHDDTRPSAHVVPASKGRGWRCFGCGAKGGVLDLAVAIGIGCDRASAARELQRRLSRR